VNVVKGPDNVREQELKRLVDAYQTSLLRMCQIHLQDSALAEDAVQETFFRAYRAYNRFRHDSSEYTWLTRIAINCCRSQRTKAWFRLEEQRANPEDLPGRHADPDMPDDTVLQTVMALTPKYKDPVLLHYYQGLPVKDIARILHVAVSTVSVRLMRARTMLKDALEEWYHDE